MGLAGFTFRPREGGRKLTAYGYFINVVFHVNANVRNNGKERCWNCRDIGIQAECRQGAASSLLLILKKRVSFFGVTSCDEGWG